MEALRAVRTRRASRDSWRMLGKGWLVNDSRENRMSMRSGVVVGVMLGWPRDVC